MLLEDGELAVELPEHAQKYSPQIRWTMVVVCNVWRQFSINPLPV